MENNGKHCHQIRLRHNCLPDIKLLKNEIEYLRPNLKMVRFRVKGQMKFFNTRSQIVIPTIKLFTLYKLLYFNSQAASKELSKDIVKQVLFCKDKSTSRNGRFRYKFPLNILAEHYLIV